MTRPAGAEAKRPSEKLTEGLKKPDILKEIRTLGKFTETYCRKNHTDDEKSPFQFKGLENEIFKKQPFLCIDCSRLLAHATVKRLLCPYDPKPMCKKCPTHCYKPSYRQKMREVMKFSGIYLIKHGRVDLIFHYYF